MALKETLGRDNPRPSKITGFPLGKKKVDKFGKQSRKHDSDRYDRLSASFGEKCDYLTKFPSRKRIRMVRDGRVPISRVHV